MEQDGTLNLYLDGSALAQILYGHYPVQAHGTRCDGEPLFCLTASKSDYVVTGYRNKEGEKAVMQIRPSLSVPIGMLATFISQNEVEALLQYTRPATAWPCNDDKQSLFYCRIPINCIAIIGRSTTGHITIRLSRPRAKSA